MGLESGEMQLIAVNLSQRSHEVAWSADRFSRHAAAVRRLCWQKLQAGRCLLASCGDDHAVKVFSTVHCPVRT